MNNKINLKKENFHTINDFSHGDWICFLLPNNNKCIGNIIEILIPSNEDNLFFDSIKTINYIDENGMHGSIKVKDLNKNQQVIGMNIQDFFDKKFSIKIEENIKNSSRKIAKDFLNKTNLKRTGNINKN